MVSNQYELSVVLFREEDVWVAQCLEYDIAAQGATLREARKAFDRSLVGQICIDIKHGAEPLSGIDRAPNEYWDKFRDGERLQQNPLQLPEHANLPIKFADERVYA